MTKDVKTITINNNINLSVSDVQSVIDIQREVLEGKESTYILYFNEIKFINAAIAVIIGTLPIYANLLDKKVFFKFKEKEKESNVIFDFMKKVGIYSHFVKTDSVNYIQQKALPFRNIVDDDTMEEYVDKIMDLAPIKMNQKASDILSSYIYEIYQNSFSHAESPIDVFSCGYWMKKGLVFSIYDMGMGIPENVRKFLGDDKTSIECVEWAFQEGTTTLDEEYVKRGLGLSRLEKFIRLNNGILSLYTDDVWCTIENGERKMSVLKSRIKGTLIIISIKADTEHIYCVNE